LVAMSRSVTAAAGRFPLRPAAVAEEDRRADKVVIALDRAQVDQVVCAASERSAISVLLGGLGDFRETLAGDAGAVRPSQMDDRRLSRSLLAGLLVLAALPADGSYVRLVDVARITGMNNSMIHRYVSTLMSVGLVERNPRTRRYRLANAERSVGPRDAA